MKVQELLKTLMLVLQNSMTKSAWSKIKTPIYLVAGLAAIYGIVYLAAGKPKAYDDTLLLQKIDSLQKIAVGLQKEQQVVLKNDVVIYKNLTKLQSQVDSIRGARSAANNYHNAVNNKIRTLEGRQVDSFFKQRYNY